MTYDEATADRVRRLLSERTDVVEKPIIGGGLGFMVDGHLCCGISERGLTVRVGRDAKPRALQEPHVAPLAIGDREAAAFVVIAPDAYETYEGLREWIECGLHFVATLPAS